MDQSVQDRAPALPALQADAAPQVQPSARTAPSPDAPAQPMDAGPAPITVTPAAATPGREVSTAKTGEILAPRRSRKKLVLLAAAIAALAYGGHRFNDWFVEGRFLVSTDDAYVKADMAIIAAKVTGYIASAPVAENAAVKAGEVLATIDDGDYRLAVAAARDKVATQDAAVARIAQQNVQQASVVAQARAQAVSAQADVVRAAAEFTRSEALARGDFGTKQRLDLARADRDRTLAAAVNAQAAIAAAEATTGVIEAQRVEAMRVRDELATALAKAERDLTFTIVRAPFDGTVGNKAGQVGQFVQPGTRLMALVPLTSVYVEANLKETQIGALRPGQIADITVDALSGRTIEGRVVSVAPASGSQYSLLPAENATGNFTKIVQRVPVRIRVPDSVGNEGVLRPGLSVVVSVHTRDETRPTPSILQSLRLDGLYERGVESVGKAVEAARSLVASLHGEAKAGAAQSGPAPEKSARQ